MTRRKFPSRADYEVGKGKPPKLNQYKPGQSGNPNGRPRKSDTPGRRRLPLQTARDMFLDEAYREVTLTEGGKPVKLPMSHAIMRAFGLTALKGSAHAQKNYLSMLFGHERKVNEEHAALFGQALMQKADLEEARQVWVRSGRDEMAMPLHPDDVQIDPVTGDVSNHAVFTAEQIATRDQLMRLRDELQWAIISALEAARTGTGSASLNARRANSERLYDEINDSLAPRFRTQRQPR